MDPSTLKRLLLAQVEVHSFSDEQVAPAHPGLRRSVLGVRDGGDWLLARVRHNQKRVGVIEGGQDQSITLSWPAAVRGGACDIMLRRGQQFRPGSDKRRGGG